MDLAQISEQSAIQANYDAKKFICGPWLKGRRGGPFTQVFKPAFEDALRGKNDNFSSLHEHIITETAVGAANGPAHPAGGGLAALNFQSQSAYKTRDQLGYNLILAHAGHDQDIEDKIKEHQELFYKHTQEFLERHKESLVEITK